MKIGYSRVSTYDQNLDLQLTALRDAGCEEIYQKNVSGVKARPEQERCQQFPLSGDTLVVY